MNTRWLLSLFALTLALLACSLAGQPAPETLSPTPTATSTILFPTATVPAPAPAATETPQPAPVTDPTATSPAPAPLSADGPWLVLYGERGLWTVNADGSGLTQWLTEEPVGLEAGSRAVSFFSADDWITYRGLALNTLSLPDGERETIALLPAGKAFAADSDPFFADPLAEAVRAVADHSRPVWSPDGLRLAFVGAQDGVSADVYVFDLETRRVTRLTDGPSQAYHLSWSPDGRQVVHVGATSFGTGAGYGLAGVWAARADGSGVRALYTPARSGDETILGWRSASQFVVHSFTAACSYYDLRAFDVETGAQQVFWNYFTRAAMDPASGALLFSVDEFVAECNGDARAGLFFVPPGAAEARPVPGDGLDVTWEAAPGWFAVRAGDFQPVLYVDAQGRVVGASDRPDEIARNLPPGRRWAWRDEGGLWVGAAGEAPRRVFASGVIAWAWTPDGQGLFWSAQDEGLGAVYRAQAPDFAPALVGEGLPGRMLWLRPTP